MINKKINKRNYCLLLFVIIFIALCIYFGYTLYCKVNILENKYNGLESRMSDVMAKDPISISKEIEHYSKITDSTVGSINAAVGILGVAAALFGLLGILFTAYTYYNNKDAEKRMIETEDKLNDAIKKYKSEMDNININHHILIADKYRGQHKTHYAINEYRRALRIDENYCLVKYELGSLLADEYASNPEDRIFFMAKDNLKNAIDCCIERDGTDKELLSDCYLALGVIYGQKGKFIKNKTGYNNYLFNKSICYFQKAITNNKYNIEIYPNMALTYVYCNDNDAAKKSFEYAIEIDKENVYKNNVTRRYYNNSDELLAIIVEEQKKEKPIYKYDLITANWKHQLDDLIKEP